MLSVALQRGICAPHATIAAAPGASATSSVAPPLACMVHRQCHVRHHSVDRMSNRAAPNTADDAIRQTDDDAALSRLCVGPSPPVSFAPSARPGLQADPPSSSVNRGLLPDPFAPYFVGFSHPSYSGNSEAGPSRPVQSVQKPVVIDVGTHHRTWAVDKLVESFLHSSAAAHGLTGGDGLDKGGVQVVSLGAGSDTRYFRLMVRCPFYVRHSG